MSKSRDPTPPGRRIVLIGGRNGQRKSSVLGSPSSRPWVEPRRSRPERSGAAPGRSRRDRPRGSPGRPDLPGAAAGDGAEGHGPEGRRQATARAVSTRSSSPGGIQSPSGTPEARPTRWEIAKRLSGWTCLLLQPATRETGLGPDRRQPRQKRLESGWPGWRSHELPRPRRKRAGIVAGIRRLGPQRRGRRLHHRTGLGPRRHCQRGSGRSGTDP